jgi:hypothetical protein
MSWRVARSLGGRSTDGLLGEINARAPHRNRAADGSIGDTSHAARRSEHNPCRCCDVVCARDFTHDPPQFDSYAFAEWLRGRVLAGEQRVLYVISNARIFSGHGQAHPAGVWRSYRGPNKHRHHVHVSVRHGPELFDDVTPWGWKEDSDAAASKP